MQTHIFAVADSLDEFDDTSYCDFLLQTSLMPLLPLFVAPGPVLLTSELQMDLLLPSILIAAQMIAAMTTVKVTKRVLMTLVMTNSK